MKITDEHKQQIEGIILEMKSQNQACLRDFECYESNLEKLCKVESEGPFDDIICDSDDTRCCGLSFTAQSKRYCRCLLRKYICEHFHR